MSHKTVMEYSLYKPKPNSEQETSILQMLYKHLGRMPPFSRRLNDDFNDIELKRIRGGEVHVAKLKEGSLVGICNICSPHFDSFVEECAVKQNCNHYLSSLIIEDKAMHKN